MFLSYCQAALDGRMNRISSHVSFNGGSQMGLFTLQRWHALDSHKIKTSPVMPFSGIRKIK